jgi:hypothetical protein
MSENNSTFVTPYAAHTFVNERLAEAGLKAIRPQMMYNYTSQRLAQGKVPFIAFTPEQGVDLESLEAWTKKYIAKKVAESYAV